jgi:phage regulator Rha-like protein
MSENTTLIPITEIERKILLVHGQRVILDSDLAALYGVTTFNLNKAVKRNRERFPSDFIFQLEAQEVTRLTFQSGISSARHGGRRKPAYAFTEQGVAMLSSVLRSPRAIQVNIEIMRAFVRLRQWLASNAELARKLAELEQKYDEQFRVVFDAIRELMTPPDPSRKRIGFGVKEGRARYAVKSSNVHLRGNACRFT